MKRLNGLKDIFRGELFALCGFVLFVELWAHIDGSSVDWSVETYTMLAGWMAFTFVMTYLMDVLVSGVINDIKETKKTIKESKEAKKA